MDKQTLRDKEQLEQALANHTLAEAAEVIGCSVSTICDWKNKHGLKASRKVRPTETVLRAELAMLGSLRAVAEKYDVSKQAVRQWCKKHGIDSSKDLRDPLNDHDTLASLAKQHSFSEIARMHGKTVAFISKLAKKHDIKSKFTSENVDIQDDLLTKLYITDELSARKVAEQLGVNTSVVNRRLVHLGIRRSAKEASEARRTVDREQVFALVADGRSAREVADAVGSTIQTIRTMCSSAGVRLSNRKPWPEILTDDKLRSLYIVERRGSSSIATEYGLRATQVANKLYRLGVKLRPISEATAKGSAFIHLSDPAWLHYTYVESGMSLEVIARLAGCAVGTVSYWLKQYDIPLRSQLEAARMLGETYTYKGAAVACRGYKYIHVSSKAGRLSLDSKNELDCVLEMDHDDSIKTYQRSPDIGFSVDFLVVAADEHYYLEVKDKDAWNEPAIERRRLIHQLKRATKDFRFWQGPTSQEVLSGISSEDKFYAVDLKLWFSKDELVDFLAHNWKPPSFGRFDSLNALGKLRKLAADPSLVNTDNCPSGLDFLRSRFDNYWDSHHKNGLSINQAMGMTNLVNLAVDRVWDKRKNLSIWDVVRSLCRYAKDVMPASLFKPWVASWIYDRVLPHGGIVLDPCAGWGGRLLGTIGRPIRYFGSDINAATVSGNRELAHFCGFCLHDPVLKVSDVRDLTVDVRPDLLFTSPPYLDTERYAGSPVGTWDVVEAVCAIGARLKIPNVVLNVSNLMEIDTLSLLDKHGYTVKEVFRLSTSSIARQRVSEPIIWATLSKE